MAIEHVDNAVPNDDSNSSMKIPSESDLTTLISEKKLRYRRLEETLNGMQNNEFQSIPWPDIPMKRLEQFNFVVVGLKGYNADIKRYEKVYQEQYGEE